jgi:hypothetical protein
MMLISLLPPAAAISAAGAAAPDVPMAIAQPLVAVPAVTVHRPNALVDAGVLTLVGSALMGLGSLVRRTTRD